MKTRATDPDQNSSPQWASWITRFAFFLAVLLVLVRATLLETLRDPFDIVPGAEAIPRGAGPATTIVLDWLMLLPALLVFARSALDRAYRLRCSWSMVPLAALALWAILSIFWSQDRFAAVVGASHFVAAASVLWAMSQLCRTWLRFRLVAAGCFGLMLALTAHGLVYRFVDVPELRKNIEQNWDQILRERGWAPGSFMETQFKKKVVNGEMVGLNASPNTYAALMVFLMVVSAGIAIQRFVDRDNAGWGTLVLVSFPLVGFVVLLTQSRAAVVTPLAAAGCFVVAAALAKPLRRRHNTFYFAAITVITAGTLGAVAYGLRNNNLVHDSLTFRWRYWVGSARMVARHPLTGVGWGNFGDQYLAVREPVASEEIKDPHNLIVRFTTELGVIGALLALAWLLRLGWELTRPARSLPDTVPLPDDARDRAEAGKGSALSALLKLSAAFVVVGALASIDFSQRPEWIFLEVIKRILLAMMLLIGLIVGSFRSFDRQEFDRRPARRIVVAMVIAAAIFLLHNVIDFAFFESGPMGAFMLVAGSVLAIRSEPPTTPSRFPRALGLLSMGAIWLAAGAVVALPIVVAESKAQSADDLVRTRDFRRAASQLLDANDTLVFGNTDYLFRAARAQVMAAAEPEDVRRTLRRAIDRNPTNGAYRRMLAEFELRQSPPDVAAYRDQFDQLLKLDPNNVAARLDYASALEQLGERSAAKAEYHRALELNDLLGPDEPKRLRPEQVAEIRAKMDSLR